MKDVFLFCIEVSKIVLQMALILQVYQFNKTGEIDRVLCQQVKLRWIIFGKTYKIK